MPVHKITKSKRLTTLVGHTLPRDDGLRSTGQKTYRNCCRIDTEILINIHEVATSYHIRPSTRATKSNVSNSIRSPVWTVENWFNSWRSGTVIGALLLIHRLIQLQFAVVPCD